VRLASALLRECSSLPDAQQAYCFPDVPPDDFLDASTPLRFADPLPEELAASIGFHVGGATARVAPTLLSRIGFTLASRTLSVVGAAVSTTDFVHSVLTNSPNRELLVRVQAYLEGEAETFRAWWVLLCHWLGHCGGADGSEGRGEGGGEGSGGGGGEDGARETEASRGAREAEQGAELRSSMMSAMESRIEDGTRRLTN